MTIGEFITRTTTCDRCGAFEESKRAGNESDVQLPHDWNHLVLVRYRSSMQALVGRPGEGHPKIEQQVDLCPNCEASYLEWLMAGKS